MKSRRSESFGRSFMLIYFKLKMAWILFSQRKIARVSADEAAEIAGITKRELRNYEFGLESPPCCVISKLLGFYEADAATILFFCMFPMPAQGIFWHIKFRWSQYRLLPIASKSEVF